MIKIKGMLLTATLLAAATAATAQQTYRELTQIASLNRGVYGLRSMADGEHYTSREGNAIVRHNYADASEKQTLYTGEFSSYTFSPGRDDAAAEQQPPPRLPPLVLCRLADCTSGRRRHARHDA